MAENLYCPSQAVLSEKGKENWDKIRWDTETERLERKVKDYLKEKVQAGLDALNNGRENYSQPNFTNKTFILNKKEKNDEQE